MSSTEIRQPPVWTEVNLAGAITGYRAKQDESGLENFLLARLEDSDPCCVLFRPRFWNEYGLLQIERENIEEAADCFQKAITIDQANISALYNLGTLHMQQGRFSDALEKFESVLLERPEHFNGLFNTGLCHLYDERKEEALSYFLRAAELQPDHGQTRYLAGEILMQQGRADEALSHFREAHKENPGHFETTMGFAIALLKTSDYREAALICDRALLVFGAATLPLQVKGDAMLALKKFREAVMCHMDLCRLDLDIRDFVVARLVKLAEEEPVSFEAYAEEVHTTFPSFVSILKNIANN
jgi:tetratricopeptide (TPR) repeat protein